MKIRNHSNPRVARAAAKFKPWDYGYMLDIETKCLAEIVNSPQYGQAWIDLVQNLSFVTFFVEFDDSPNKRFNREMTNQRC